MPTYRITKPYTAKSRPIIFKGEMIRAILEGRKTQTRRVIKAEWSRCLALEEPEDLQKAIDQCPYGKPGDFFWVRETFWEVDGYYFYRADDHEDFKGWKPSIHMPRKASRITLKIIEVQVEQVQQITKPDVIKEGIPQFTFSRGILSDDPPDPRWKFIELWDSINAKKGYGWSENSWVWVIDFERVEDG